MPEIRFVWDVDKARANLARHHVSFAEACSVFRDENAREFYDPEHSELEEDRFLMLGLSNRLRLLLVCHCYREDEDTIRIISARRATRREGRFYAAGGNQHEE